MNNNARNIDNFIAKYPENVQEKLQSLRRLVKNVCPDAQEKISYGIPTFTFRGNLVHFSAYDKHIGFYPGSAPIAAFQEELQPYKTSKGTVQFPLDAPLPYELIEKITKYAVERNLNKKGKAI
ncbi:DUF1801 domain-containing protein [Candidatus Saccharibacteria bacterium]|nr:DUF1801 domain-containing protein [Candidatus Saccharibacteria bacterium]